MCSVPNTEKGNGLQRGCRMGAKSFEEMMLGGTLVIIGIVLALAAIGIIAVFFLLPLAMGYAITIAAYRLYDKFHPPKPWRNAYENTGWQPQKPERINWRIERKKEGSEAEEDDGEDSDWNEGEEDKLAEKPQRQLDRNFYLERKLMHAEREELLARGYKRVKISPYGDSGASYYLVRTRWNEGKEHAFFCYLIESELRKRGKNVELFVNNGPDIVFRHKKKEYCIDVETGTNLARDREKVRRKFEYYAQQYHRSYIFVTRKRLKQKYRKFGIVITRASLRKVLSPIWTYIL